VPFIPRFFPYNPRKLRIAMFVAAVLALALAAAVAARAPKPLSTPNMARIGAYLGLAVAFLVPYFRLRPRAGWGVGLSETEVKVARPFTGETINIPWANIAHALRTNRNRTLLLVLDPAPGRVIVSRPLFQNQAAFDALCDALEEVKPRPRLDA
jgi:hypothetical protein